MSEALVGQIAESLSESNVELVRKVIEVLGAERTEQFLQRAIETEANGGLMVKQGNRRRTPGGVFFYLVRTGVEPAERKLIFPQGQGDAAARPPTPPPPPPPTWEEARAIAIKLLTTSKGAGTVKLTLVGRPKQVGKQKGSVFCIMEGRSAPTTLPKGLPTPPENVKQNVVVFIAEKQWRRLEESLRTHQDDALIVEGWPYFDPARQMTVLLAQSATTKLIQRGRKQEAASGE